MKCLFVEGKDCPETCYHQVQNKRTGTDEVIKALNLRDYQQTPQEQLDYQKYLLWDLASTAQFPSETIFACGKEAWDKIIAAWHRAHDEYRHMTDVKNVRFTI